MGAISQGSTRTEGAGSYERAESGVYAARCFQVVELGTHKSEYKGEVKDKKELMIFFELAELMQDGRPFVVSWRGTNSLNEKGNLFKMLCSWRGKQFTPAELAKFELKKVLNIPCMVNITKEIAKGSGKEYNKLISVMPMPKGMPCPDLQNPMVDFGINDIDTPEFDKLYPYVKTIILESKEAKVDRSGTCPISNEDLGDNDEFDSDKEDEVAF